MPVGRLGVYKKLELPAVRANIQQDSCNCRCYHTLCGHLSITRHPVHLSVYLSRHLSFAGIEIPSHAFLVQF